MKIKTIEINNFRSIQSETIDCEAYNSFIGPNGSGKSTVLNALNIFFGEINNFSEEDFYARNTQTPILIKVTFTDLSDLALEEFKHYVRNNLLVVGVEITKDNDDSFKRVIRGERMVFEPFKEFFETSGAGPRKKVFDALREEYSDIENATNDGGRESSLRDYEELLDEDKKTLTASGAEFFGISKGTHKFQRHIHWVYVPAVKDASTESEEAKSSHLGKLIQHTIRSGMDYDSALEKIKNDALQAYKGLLDGQRGHLNNLQKNLSQRLKDAVTTEADLELDWKKDEKSVAVSDPVAQVLLKDKGFSGGVEKFGHGLQRSFLIVILQELMAVDSEVTPTLLLGCEEPELYQHPPQAKHLASILMELSSGDAQIFITSHSPYFIDVEHYAGIKVFRNSKGKVSISSSTFSSILEGYNEAFGKPLRNEDQARTKLAIQTQPKYNEVFFTDKVVLVEGISDQACFESYLRVSGKHKDFQRSGISIVVCEGKSSLALMLLIVKDFNIPFHVVFDCDSACEEKDKALHIHDNNAVFQIAGLPNNQNFPTTHIFDDKVTAWLTDIEDVLENEFGDAADEIKQCGRDAVGNLKSSKKHPLYVATVVEDAWIRGKKFPTLEQVVNTILGS